MVAADDIINRKGEESVASLSRKRRIWTHVDELLLLLLRHLRQAVVPPTQVVLQAGQGVDHHPLHLPALCSRAGGGQAQPPNTAARPHTGRQYIALVKLARLELQPTHMLLSFSVSPQEVASAPPLSWDKSTS